MSIQKGLLKRVFTRFGLTFSAVLAAFLLHGMLTAYGGPGLPTYITFYPAVMLVAIVAGFWPGLAATAMLVLVAVYWILPPQGSFRIERFIETVGLIFFASMGVCMSLVGEFYRRTRRQAQKSSSELAKANEVLRHLSSKLLSAHEDERKRIAGELHDTLGASLSAIKFRVEDALYKIGKTSDAATEPLNALIPMIRETIEECRGIQLDLRPSMLDDLGLLPTLSWFCRRFQTIYSGIQIEQKIEIEEGDVPPTLKIVVFRVTQEALNNIAKHSQANLVRLSLRKREGQMELILKDNGQGFNLEKILSLESAKRGLGLLSMRERAEFSGGSFAIEPTEGRGTIIRASWPVEPSKAQFT